MKEIAVMTLVQPHLKYASPFWNPHSQRNGYKVKSVHPRAARFVLENYTYDPKSSIKGILQI